LLPPSGADSERQRRRRRRRPTSIKFPANLHLLSGRRRPKTFRTTAVAVKRVQRLCTAGRRKCGAGAAGGKERAAVAAAAAAGGGARRPVRNRKKIKCRHRRKLNGRRRHRREKKNFVDRSPPRPAPVPVHAVAPTRRLTVTHRPKRTHRTAALSARLASYKRGGGDEECMYRAKQMQLQRSRYF